MSAPTWGDLIAFCKADKWQRARETRHTVYKRVLADGTALQTEVSRGKNSVAIGAGLFHFILRAELHVSEAEFWETIRTAKPAPRPGHPVPAAVSRRPDAGLVFQLRKYLALTDAEMGKLSRDEAIHKLNKYYSRASEEPGPD